MESLILTGFALLVAIFAVWQQVNIRVIDKGNKDLTEKYYAADAKLNRISRASTQQYHILRDHIMRVVDPPDPQRNKEEIVIKLRKIELSCYSNEIQKEALLYFAGTRHGKHPDIIKYIHMLHSMGEIDKDNMPLALRIIASSGQEA